MAIEHWETGFHFSYPLVLTNIGKPLEHGGLMGFYGINPFGYVKIAIEHGRRNSEFSH